MNRKQQLPLNLPMALCFSLADTSGANPPPKRARFEPRRKTEVAKVRALGACLRCRHKKITCSGARPCRNCLDAANSRHASQNLWMRCVPSVLGALTNFFQGDVRVSENALKNILSKNNHLTANPVYLDYEDHVEWNINALSNELAMWMGQNNRASRISIVGIMSSFRFQQLLSLWIPHPICCHFQLLMYTSSIVYSHGFQHSYCSYSQEDFNTIRLFTGTKVLKGLEILLKPAQLAESTSEKRRAIFLLLFGSVLAVSYHNQPDGSMQRVSSREFSQNQEKLISILSHRLVDLADRLALIHDSVSKQALVDSAKNQFDMPQSFVWKDSTAAVKGNRGMAGKLPMNAWDHFDNTSHSSVQEFPPFIGDEINGPSFSDQISIPDESVARVCRQCGIQLPHGDWIECYSCKCLNEMIDNPFVWIANQPLPEVSLTPVANEFALSSSLSLSDNTLILDYDDGSLGIGAPFEAFDVLSGTMDTLMPDWAPTGEPVTNMNQIRSLI